MKELIQQLQEYEKLDIELQAVTGISLVKLIEVARVCTLYIDINGEKYSLYTVADALKKTSIPFYDIYNFLFKPISNVENKSVSIKEVLNKISE
jgi:hypothetical protein